MSDARTAQWLDKLEVTELVMKLARGIDRCDADLLRSVFWPDATDDHGIFKGTASAFVEWVIPVLKGMERTSHQICNVLVEVRGARAFSESYFIAYHRIAQGADEKDMVAAGRYLDRHERRGGEWRIAHRQTVYDWHLEQAAADADWRKPPMLGLLDRGRRFGEDRSDRERDAWLGGA